MNFSEAERDLVARLRTLNAPRRHRLIEEADALDAADTGAAEERLAHLRRAVSLWSLSDRQTEELLAQIEATRETAG